VDAADGSKLEGAARRGLLVASGFVVVSIALVALGLTVADRASEAQQLLDRVNPASLVAGAVLMSCGPLCLAARWRALFPPNVRAPLAPLTTLLLVGTLLNYALPGPVGEFVAAALAARRFGLTAEAAFAAGLLARFVGLGLAGSFALLLLLSGAVPLPPDYATWMKAATGLVACSAVVLAVLGAWPRVLHRLSELTVARFRLLAGLHRSIGRFAEALHALGSIGAGAWLRAITWAAAGHLCVMGGVWIGGVGVGDPPGWPGLVFTYAASTAGAVMLFAFPGAQVGWDAMFASLLATTAGVKVATAAALTLLIRLQQLLLVALGAVALATWLRNGSGGSSG
jgi:hypothetical protein